MSENMVVGIMSDALTTVIKVSAPVLIVSLVVGLLISIFQATTQIQEQTLTFVPKIIAVFASIIIFGTWMLHTLMDFTNRMVSLIPTILH